MYELFVKPDNYPGYIEIGITYINNIQNILDIVKRYIESVPIDNIYGTTILQKYKTSKFLQVSVRDCYDNDKEIYSTIYDIEAKDFIKEV